MTRSSTRIAHLYHWGIIGLAGAIWTAGLSRTLAQDFHLPFYFRPTGTLLSCVIGTLAAIFIALYNKHKGVNLGALSQQFLPLYLPLFDILNADPHQWRGLVLLTMSLLLVLLTHVKIGRGVGMGIAILIPFLVYLTDISPYVGRADTFEFQVIAPKLGIAHPSGYPLYILIGKFFSFFPFGTIAWRVNLSSSVLASLASGVLYLALTEISNYLPDSPKLEYHNIVRILCALTLAFSPTLWSRAVEAEVYALNACIVALTLWIACCWYTGRFTGQISLPLLGILTGLALASHITLGALIAIVVVLMVYKRKEIRKKTLILSFLLGFAGLCLYLYIPLRWPAVNSGEVMSLDHFIHFVTNAESGGALLPRAFIDDPSRLDLVFRLIRQQVSWGGIFLAAAGLATLLLNSLPLAVGSLLSFSAWVWFGLSFYVAEPDYSAFLIPGHVVIVFWLGVGAMSVLHLIKRYIPGLMSLGFIALALLPSSRLWINGPSLNTMELSHGDEKWARYVLSLPIEKNAVILADSEKFPPLYYLQQVEDIRPDLELVTQFNEAQYRNALNENLASGRMVYMARYLPGLDEYGVSSLGPLVRIAPANQTAETDTENIVFGDKLALRHFSLFPDPEGRPMHHLTLHWLSLDDIQSDLEVRIRLVTPQDGHIAWVNEPTRPVGGYSSTTAWVKGTVVQDYYALTWPDWLPSANYNLEIGLFPRFSDKGLLVNNGTANWTSITAREFGTTPANLRSMARSMTSKQLLYGDEYWLLGIDISREVFVSSTTKVDLMSMCSNQLTRSLIPQFFWATDNGTDFIPAAVYEQSTGKRTTGNLLCNQQAEMRRYNINTPAIPGNYSLVLGLLNAQDDVLPARCQWLGWTQTSCSIARVTVIPQNSGIANYNNTLLLVDTAMDIGGIPAGGPLSVSMQWRGLRSMDKDYTMFLQVIGPDGKIYGQVDSWPQQGGRPTSGWLVGEEIHDVYSVYIKEGAPPGQYNIILGWYLLADMRRIPVITGAGEIVNDFYELGSFTLLTDSDVE